MRATGRLSLVARAGLWRVGVAGRAPDAPSAQTGTYHVWIASHVGTWTVSDSGRICMMLKE